MVQAAKKSQAMSLTVIDGINELNIRKYFALLNQCEFDSVAALFATQGYLQPPFDQIIQGRRAIAEYLERETRGMRFYPEFGKELVSNIDYTQSEISGRVETGFFTVSIKWLMQLNSVKEISSVEVKLLDSLSDLLNIKNSL
jgi:hypothetical protein